MRLTRILATTAAALTIGTPFALTGGGRADAATNFPGAMQVPVKVVSSSGRITASSPSPYNSNGTVTVGRTGVGDYWVKGRHLLATKGIAQVTLTEASAPNYCTVAGVTAVSDGTKVRVRCFSPVTGARADVPMLIVWFNSFRFTNIESATSYFTLTSTTGSATHTPSTQHRSSGTARARVSRNARGQYAVRLPGANWTELDGVVTATARSLVPRTCNVSLWYPSGADLVIDVSCFDNRGAFADSRFGLVATLTNQVDTPLFPGGTQWVHTAIGASDVALSAYGFHPVSPNFARRPDSGRAVTTFFTPADAFMSTPMAVLVSGYQLDVHCYISDIQLFGDAAAVSTLCLDGVTGAPSNAAFSTMLTGLAFFE